MNQPISAEVGCPLCVFRGHVCDRPPDESCRECRSSIVYHINGTQQAIRRADSLDLAAARVEIHKRRVPGSLITLNARGVNKNSLNVYIKSSTGRRLDFSRSVIISGDFSTHNLGVRKLLDTEIRHSLSATIKATEVNVSIIAKACTACGYAAFLCSVTEVTETSYTAMNGVEVTNGYQHPNLKALFRDFSICRLRELIDEVMEAARTIHTSQTQQDCSNAYVASGILYYELKYFKENLENGHLRTLVPRTFKRILVNWFGSLATELLQRLREGCGRYEYWRYAIDGSLNSLRRNGETYEVHLWLQRNKWTTDSVPTVFSSTIPAAVSASVVAPETLIATSRLVAPTTPYIIAGADERLSYVDPGPWWYNAATRQPVPTHYYWTLDMTRNYGHYSGQYPF